MSLSDVPPEMSWLRERGAAFPGAAPVRTAEMGLGLLAPRALHKGDRLLAIPRDLWLSRKSPHILHGELAARLPDELIGHSMSRLALVVALERSRGVSLFAPYLDGLGAPTVPYRISAQEDCALQGLPLRDWITDQREALEAERLVLCRWLRAIAHSGQTPSRAAWEWAYGHVMQRTFTVDIDAEEVWVLVPGMDLCNHDPNPNAEYHVEDGNWVLTAARSIAAGEPITISYGRAKTSSDLLLYFGFVTEEIQNDRLRLELAARPHERYEAEKRAAVDVLGLQTSALVGPSGDVPSAFLHAAILWCLEDAVFNSPAPDVSNPAHVVTALEAVARSIEDALPSEAPSMERDLAENPPVEEMRWLPAIRQYRDNARRLHQQAAAGIRRRIGVIQARGWSPSEFVADDPDGRGGLATIRVLP